MRHWLAAFAIGAAGATFQPQSGQAPSPKGIRLSDVTWADAEPALGPGAVVVIPIGAGSEEHGLHLKLGTDLTMATYLATRVVTASNVVVAPPVTYHFHPGFLDYPGSTSLNLETAKSLTLDVVRSLARYGPRRFYALNTTVATTRALEQTAATLAGEGVLFAYTDFGRKVDQLSAGVRRQEGGSHADEIETSMMLYIDAASVEMERATKEFARGGSTPLRLTRARGSTGSFSASGVWGDPTLATRDKGAQVVEGLVRSVLDDIETVRRSALPAATSAPAAPRPPAPPPRPGTGTPPGQCAPGTERGIQQLTSAYSASWSNGDAEAFATLWTDGGDVIHPDGAVERSRTVIQANRSELFRRREYRGSKHPLRIGNIRCITPTIAIVDGKWEMLGVSDAAGKPLPAFEGQFTMVLNGGIEAYRYTLKASSAPLPTWLKKPGWPEVPK